MSKIKKKFNRFVMIYEPLLHLLGWSLPLLLLAGVLFAPGLEEAKRLWSLRWLRESNELFEENKKVEAMQKALSASYWNPYNPEIQLNLARKGLHAGHPESITWWEKVIDHPDVESEDFLLFFQFALERKRMNVIERYFRSYRQYLPVTEDSLLLQVEILRAQRRVNEAIELIDAHVKSLDENWRLHRLRVQLVLELPNLERRRTAVDYLFSLLDREPELSLSILRMLVGQFHGELLEGEKSTVWEKLEANPLAEKEKAILKGIRQIEAGESIEVYRKSFEEGLDFSKNEDLLVLCNWLTLGGHFQVLIDAIPDERVWSDRALFLHRIIAYHRIGEIEEAFNMTIAESAESPLGGLETAIIQAKVQLDSGQEEDYDESLDLALQIVEPKEFLILEQELLRLDEYERLIKLLNRYLENPKLEKLGRTRMLQVYYKMGDIENLRNLIFDADFGDFGLHPASEAFHYYFGLLFQRKTGLIRRRLENLVLQYPNIQPLSVILAFAYYQSGNKNLAYEVLLEAKIDETVLARVNRVFRIAEAIILANQGNREKANALLRLHGEKASLLLPQEINLLRPAGAVLEDTAVGVVPNEI